LCSGRSARNNPSKVRQAPERGKEGQARGTKGEGEIVVVAVCILEKRVERKCKGKKND